VESGNHKEVLRTRSVPRIVPNLGWWMGGLLFASTVINYNDRQALSALAPHLKTEFH